MSPRQPVPRAKRVSRWTVVATVAMAGLLAGASTNALWSDDEVFTPTITAGYIHFTVGDPTDPVGPVPAPFTPTWSVPADLLGDGTAGNPFLEAGQTAVAVVQIDGQSQGNRGLSYALPAGGVVVGDPTGTGELASGLVTTIIAVATPAECTVAAIEADPAPVYAGPIADAVVPSTELVTAAYSSDPYTVPETDYLCFGFTVPEWEGTYANTGTVQAQDAGGTAVTDSDTWNAVLLAPAEQYVLDVDLTFAETTYRPGGGP
jgi:predicted ribosomally synthesized peptide with SipW-like signal peptide